MNRKSISIICLLLLNLGIFVPNAFAARSVLSVPAYRQETNTWCWAASCKSIIQYCEGASPTQQSIVNSIPDGDDGASLEEAKQALENWNVVSSMNKYEALTYQGVQSQINNNHPILADLTIGDGWVDRHANVIRGYDTSTNFVLYIDPTDGNYHGQTYSSYVDGIHWDGRWWELTGSIFDCQ